VLQANEFHVGAHAVTPFQHNQASGNLYFDGDGSAHARQILVAHLPSHLDLQAHNIVVGIYHDLQVSTARTRDG